MEYFDGNIKNLTTLIREGIQDYIYIETTNYENVREALDVKMRQSFMVCGMVSVFAIFVAGYMTIQATRSVTVPIRELCDMTEKVAEGDFSVRTRKADMDEIGVLSQSFNEMTEEIGTLVEDIKQQQVNLHLTETKLLQAQINPHFLYNTLDTIVWLAEEHKTNEVVNMVTALSSFFRTTLSKGRDFITVEEEESHIRSYLEIQQFRYQDILDYRIEINEELRGYVLPKLTLQPLVENAIYHGMEFMDGDGEILVRAGLQDGKLCFLVADNGLGMTEEQVEQILAGQPHTSSRRGSGIGVKNVNERIRLYFGEEYGLSIDSEPDEGTRIRICLPAVSYQDLTEREKP